VEATEGLSSCLVNGEVNASGVIRFRLPALILRLLPVETFIESTKEAFADVGGASVDETIIVSSPFSDEVDSGGSSKTKIILQLLFVYQDKL